jgi:hypothetical protein
MKAKKGLIGIATNFLSQRNRKGMILLLEAIMIASVFVAMVPIGGAQAAAEAKGVIEIWHVLLAISILLAILTFTYPLISRRKRREKVIKILKEAKAMEKEIEEEEGLTTAADVVLSQILCGINDIKALILFGVGVLVALNLTIISLI